jgi:hypothetical protein
VSLYHLLYPFNEDEELAEGFYSIYHTNDLKEGILNISGKNLTQVVHDNLLF